MSEFLGAFHLIRPAALLLVPLAVGLWWAWRRSADPLRGWRRQMDAELLRALVVEGGSSARGGLGLLLGWLLAILAVAGPTWRLEPNPFAEDATPLMVLLKAHADMERPEPSPSPLEQARLKIADLGQARRGQPLGLIAYAGSAHLVLPPTRDTAIVARMAAEIRADILPVAGDRLDLALREAARVLAEDGSGGSVVVLADRVETDPESLRRVAEEASPSAPLAVQFLALGPPGSEPDASLRAAARALDASVEALDVEGADVAAIVRGAARAPVARDGAQGDRWQEAGYWLVPLLGWLVLGAFRREDTGRASA